jgi:F0F1-type ATP synthase assembly protein I
MDNSNKKEDKSTWAIGGGVLIGVGVGIFYIRTYPLGIVAFTLIGIGLGLIITSIISRK